MKMTRIFPLLILSILIMVSCNPDDEVVKMYNAGIVSDIFGWEDNGISEYGVTGMEYMGNLENINPYYYESFDTLDIEANIQAALEDSCDLIIALSSRAEVFLVAAAIENPFVDFILLDHEADTTLDNLQCIVFDVEEAAFPCGYLAAAYANIYDSITPAAGWIKANQYEDSDDIQTAFVAGVEYFNSLYDMSVTTQGVTIESIDDDIAASAAVDSLVLNSTASIIFPFAGMSNSGAYTNIQSYELAAIGMEMDSYYDFSSEDEIFVSSCVKRYDLAVADKVLELSSVFFNGGKTIHYNLSNQGVWLAGYHDYSDIIPDSITDGINDIIQGIISGDIEPLEE